MRKVGFTLIEISLFLAISGLLFFGVTVGVQSSIRQQRYNDAVQSFAEFLRTVYSEVMNVENIDGENGRSEKAIYGKLITFGESFNSLGSNNSGEVFVYNVIGDVRESTSGNGSVNVMLKDLNANILESNGSNGVRAIGAVESYTPRWQAQIEVACNNTTCSSDVFRGMVLVVRHPSSGMISTYYSDAVYEANEKIRNSNGEVDGFKNTLNGFKTGQIDFCVNPEPGTDNFRRDVRIVANARNTSGVEVIADNSEGNKCRRN